MKVLYQTLLDSSPSTACESAKSYVTITERHIQALWFEQKYFRNLCTLHNEPIQVISPGIWNAEAGPDFLKAHLRIGSKEMRGDIEIHLHPSGWIQHGHQDDEKYANVILHLTLWNSERAKPIIRKDGVEIVAASLEKALTVTPARIIQLIDLDLYPYKNYSGTGRCAQHIFSKLPEQKIELFFKSAAYWRLKQKKSFLKTQIEEPSQQLIVGIAMALGYKHNARAFFDLSQYLFPFKKLPYEELLSLALKCCGFLDERSLEQWEESDYFTKLKSMSLQFTNHQFRVNLRLDQIRPANHPLRRLAYLTLLLNDPESELLWTNFLTIWKSHFRIGSSKLRKVLLESIPTYQNEYWNSHYTFEKKPQKTFIALIGEDLKKEMLINTFLPLLYDKIKEKGEHDEFSAFELFLESLVAPYTNKSDYLGQRFFGDTAKTALLKSSQNQQGAYQLHKDFCIHYEASCEGCPFIDLHFLIKIDF